MDLKDDATMSLLEKTADPPKPAPKPAVAAKAEMTDREFVIKNLRAGKWQLPPVDLLHADQDEAVTGDINANN